MPKQKKQAAKSRTFDGYMLPALTGLRELGDRTENAGGGVHIRVLRDWIKNHLSLTEEETAILLPSGKVTVFSQRVSWAVHWIAKAGLIERVERGKYRILENGRNLLKDKPEKIDKKLLQKNYPAFAAWHDELRSSSRALRLGSNAGGDSTDSVNEIEEDPLLALEQAAEHYNRVMENDILERVLIAPAFLLEQIAERLLVALGYGEGKVTGKSGDGGVDVVIKQDALGLDKIFVQVKRFAPNNTVGENYLRDFVGSLEKERTKKGVFITTSRFTAAAETYVKDLASSHSIVLVDGSNLARMMRKHNVGVRQETAYWKVSIDEDFFDECD